MKRKTGFILFNMIAAVALAAGWVQASSQAGTSAAQFLKIGAGSKAAAMAEAYTAVADDVYSVYYNPAGLTRATVPEFAGQYVSYFQDSGYNFLAFAYPFGREKDYSKHALGLSIYTFRVNDLERRTQDTDLAAGLFDSSDMAYALSYSYRLKRELGLGATLKYVRSKIDDVSAGAVAVDVGAQYQPNRDWPLYLGLNLRNMGSRMKFGDESDPLPFGVAFGAGYVFFSDLKLDLDVVKYRDTDVYFSGGAEYRKAFMDKLEGSLRAGYTTHYQDIDGFKGFATGAGLRYSSVGFDFAWVPFGDLGNTFRYTLSVKF